jgi:hypothetical protein
MAVASSRPAARRHSGGWATGDETGLPIPMDAHALREGGPQFLTEAFHAFGGLSPGNGVAGISRCDEVTGGSTGRKALLSIEYRTPAPHRDLFVKFSRDLEDPTRDHGRTQMAPEVAFARLSRADAFPVSVPSVLFADYEASSGTGILVTERIPFGSDGIEPQHPKCMDYEMPDPLSHYRALLGAVARLAGTDAAGRLPNQLDADMEQLSVGERPPLTAAKLERQVDGLADFAAAHQGLLPANVRSPSFLSRLRIDLPRLLECEPVVWQHLRSRPEFVALCHWNANVDNAWFWGAADGTLRCGLMDWGCVGQMNVAMAIWGSMCSAETQLWDHHLPELLTLFAGEFLACGGPTLDVGVLGRHVLLYAAVMGMTWLLDVPGYVRSRAPDLTRESTRTDPAVRDCESVRCRLQMMTNVLNLLATHDLGLVLDEIVG